MKRNEMIGGIVIFLFGAITVLFSLKMSLGTFRMAGSGLFPLCLGILLMVLSILLLIKVSVQDKQGMVKKGALIDPSGSGRQVLFVLGAMALATLLFNTLGYLLASFLLMLALLRTLGLKKWTINLPISFMTAVVSYFLFVQWLKIPLPKGWIGI